MVAGNTTAIQVDHIVALGNAWKTGACHWPPSKRKSFAIDVAERSAMTRVLKTRK